MKTIWIALWGMCLASVSWAQPADTLQRIRDAGAVVMGVRDSSGAISYALGNGRYAGFQVEVCERVLQDIQRKLELPRLDIRYQLVSASNRITMVQNGTVDLECGSTTNNLARQRDVAFSVTTMVEEVRIAVRADSGIQSVAHLNGKTVVTTVGSTSVQVLRRRQRDLGLGFTELQCRDHGECFAMLESGRADAFIMDSAILAGNIARSRNPADFKIVGEALSLEPIAIMLRKGDEAFKQAVDESIKQMMRSGEMARLWSKWFEQPIPPSNVRVGMPLNENTRLAWASPNDRPKEAYPLR
ncbi:amino acid ABC transporter substrate-binding protein [Tepidicella xavieri]|uniref:Amino acid ABC transporter substrate-binding protein (PAAT family) n=1 Tax=Tepidicella xavieri TaxID=360241 RepID=A0A4R6UF50_9BURK|nr:amino acid ABC transporter substrate-binding protein [Tepidicella xavieri]TDQ44822.1 amino acid ABC transporter substrate-binding protein (PAAT family) [Tepidicella xavieri]